MNHLPKYFFTASCLIIPMCIAVSQVFGDEDNHGVLAGGVVHNIAADRKVEKIGGIMQPEPLDLYLKRLFDEVFIRLDTLDQRLQNIEKVIQSQPQTASASLKTDAAKG